MFKYHKIIHGVCEIVYDGKGNPSSVRFIPTDSSPVERRMIREEGEVVKQGEYEDDELIENPEDICYLEGIEKFVALDIVKPKC